MRSNSETNDQKVSIIDYPYEIELVILVNLYVRHNDWEKLFLH